MFTSIEYASHICILKSNQIEQVTFFQKAIKINCPFKASIAKPIVSQSNVYTHFA